MHPILARQLKRCALFEGAPPADDAAWSSLLGAVSNAYEQADQDRYLLERSLSLSSEEMGSLHHELAAERDTISSVICSLDEGVCAVNNAGEVLFINPEAMRLLRISTDALAANRALLDLVEAQTAAGVPLGDLLTGSSAPGPDEGGEEPRLIVAGDMGAFIAYSVTPLGEHREGTVLTLHDVSGRKRLELERQELNKRLQDVSRQAGMAEVASNVIHNVGNVLNSVNVSCSLAMETVKASKCADVERLAELFAQHNDHLGEYLTDDPAGSKIPEYLARLGGCLLSERDRLLRELEAVRQSTDHIREIVGAQQSFAKGGSLREMEDLQTLVEESLRMVGPSLLRHGVRVVREFQPVPPVYVERHQVLHVFINLINNAKQASAEMPDSTRTITIRIAPRPGRVVAEVIDDGCGIPPENLTRIFSHGFTTRHDGHGFGLHSAALAAKAMDGEISARSDGIGRGATFTLDLPAGKPQKTKVA